MLNAAQVALIDRLAHRLITTRPMRFTTLKSFAKRGLDIIDVEQTVQALTRAGWLEIEQRRDRRGELVNKNLRMRDDAADIVSSYLGRRTHSERKTMLGKLVRQPRSFSLVELPRHRC